MSKPQELLELIAKTLEPSKTECPKCHKKMTVKLDSVWKEHQMTLSYEFQDGHLMMVDEFVRSISGFASAIKEIAKQFGKKVAVQIIGLEVSQGKVSITVLTSEIRSKERQ